MKNKKVTNRELQDRNNAIPANGPQGQILLPLDSQEIPQSFYPKPIPVQSCKVGPGGNFLPIR